MTDAPRIRSTPKVPKQRASCDACNEAKVRCSQTRPNCARCLKQDRRCVYGISQRSGKRSAGSSVEKESTLSTLPVTPPTADVELSSSSPSTIDPKEFMLLFPSSAAQGIEPTEDQQLHKDWAFDNTLFMPNEPSTAHTTPVSYDQFQSMFGRENLQPQVPGLYTAKFDTSSVGLGSGSPHSISEKQSSDRPCLSCATTNLQNHDYSSPESCRCNQIIITQLAVLPVLLHNERSAFDLELMQFQKAIKLCAGVLACTCAGKDYTSILSIGMLLARIVSVFERGGARVDCDGNSGTSIDMVRSPRFSVGMYQIEGEDENNLKQEVWWLQIRKVESLVEGFKEMVGKVSRQQMYQESTQASAWENITLLLDQRVQAIKREWSDFRDRA